METKLVTKLLVKMTDGGAEEDPHAHVEIVADDSAVGERGMHVREGRKEGRK